MRLALVTALGCALLGPAPGGWRTTEACAALESLDERVVCAARSNFSIELPDGFDLIALGGSVDFADFAVRQGASTYLFVHVGNFPFDTGASRAEGFGRGAPGEVRSDLNGRRRTHVVRDGSGERIVEILLLTSAYEDGGWPRYVLVRAPELTPEQQAVAERIAGSVRAR